LKTVLHINKYIILISEVNHSFEFDFYSILNFSLNN